MYRIVSGPFVVEALSDGGVKVTFEQANHAPVILALGKSCYEMDLLLSQMAGTVDNARDVLAIAEEERAEDNRETYEETDRQIREAFYADR
jgi:hypothetical protein